MLGIMPQLLGGILKASNPVGLSHVFFIFCGFFFLLVSFLKHLSSRNLLAAFPDVYTGVTSTQPLHPIT